MPRDDEYVPVPVSVVSVFGANHGEAPDEAPVLPKYVEPPVVTGVLSRCNRADENGSIASAGDGSAKIPVGSCSCTVRTHAPRVIAVPPFAACRSARKKLRVPEPVCGING